MEAITKNWALILGAFLAWRWYVADRAGVPFGYSLSHPLVTSPEALRTAYVRETATVSVGPVSIQLGGIL